MSLEAFSVMRCGHVKQEPGRLFHCTSSCRETGRFSAAMTCLSNWNATSARQFPAPSFLLTWNLRKTPPLGQTLNLIARIVLRGEKTINSNPTILAQHE